MDMTRFANDVLANMAKLQEGHRVTDFRVDVLEIADADYWKLPDRTRELMRLYCREVPCQRPGVWRFEMSIERWPEIEASMRGDRSRREAGDEYS